MESVTKIAFQILTDYRGLFCTVVLLPLSIILNTLQWISMQYRIYSANAQKHNERVANISAAMRRLNEESKASGEKAQEICTARPGWANVSVKMGENKANKRKIDMKQLVDILELNEKEMYIRVEPLVNMGQVTSYLVPRGYTLPVVPELDELTAGGLACGFGIESTSHVYGLFQEVVCEYELILADGSVVIATATNEYKDLFHAIPWSHGSVAMIASLKIKIIRCKKYVTLRYRRCDGLKRICSAFAAAAEAPAKLGADNENIFCEMLQYSLTKAVLMEGRLTNDVPSGSKFNDIGVWYHKWFYQHCEDIINKLRPNDEASYYEETIPLRSYYHRHTKAIFFEMPHIIPFADQLWFRFLLGWALPPNIPLLKVSQPPEIRRQWKENFMVQDMLVPVSKLEETLQFCDDKIDLYPMWLCPHLVIRHKEGGQVKPSRFVDKNADREMYVDVGLYGVPARQPYNHITCMREFEEFVRSVDGYQGLYAVCYCTLEEFREMFDHELYDKVREKYGAKGRFPETFKKVADNPDVNKKIGEVTKKK